MRAHLAGTAEKAADHGQGMASAAAGVHEAAAALQRALETAAAQGRTGAVAVKVSLQPLDRSLLQAARSQHAFDCVTRTAPWVHDKLAALWACARRCSTQMRCRR